MAKAKAKRPATPTRRWQALVPELPPFVDPDNPDSAAEDAAAADTAERLLLLLHYAIDWQNSWVRDRLKTYWDVEFVNYVRVAAVRNDTLDGWWSDAKRYLEAVSPSQPDRRLELAQLLREPPDQVLAVLLDKLPALTLRVQIITEAVRAERL